MPPAQAPVAPVRIAQGADIVQDSVPAKRNHALAPCHSRIRNCRNDTMKVVVALVIAGVAGLMAFVFWRGECAGGSVVTSQAQCLRTSGFSAATCEAIFEAAERVTRAAATVYPMRDRCLQDYERCVPSSQTQGFTPVPAGFCVTASASAVTRREPVYRRINTATQEGRN